MIRDIILGLIVICLVAVVLILADILGALIEIRPTVTEVHQYHYPQAEFVTIEADRVAVGGAGWMI